MKKQVNIHAVLPRSRANGPGERMVIWFQGCPLACPGCFNPETHHEKEDNHVPIEYIFNQIESECPNIEGISISGGEPFAQPDALLQIADWVRNKTDLSILVFSGYTGNEIRKQEYGEHILELLDVLIAGRYVENLHHGKGLLGSTNQAIHFLSSRYSIADLEETPECEITIDNTGKLVLTGVELPSF